MMKNNQERELAQRIIKEIAILMEKEKIDEGMAMSIIFSMGMSCAQTVFGDEYLENIISIIKETDSLMRDSNEK